MNCAEKLLEPTIFFNLYNLYNLKAVQDIEDIKGTGIMKGDCTHNPEDWKNKSIK